jgi:hypothetical protein
VQRAEIEIQRAHDILHFLGTPEAPAVISDTRLIHAVHDALAWILGYPCGEAFERNLQTIKEELARLGFVEIDMGRLIYPDE